MTSERIEKELREIKAMLQELLDNKRPSVFNKDAAVKEILERRRNRQ